MTRRTPRALLASLCLCASVTACEVPLTEGAYACVDDDGCPRDWVCGADLRCYETCTGDCLADAGTDGGTDAGADGGVDGGPDAGADAGGDGGVDAGPAVTRNCACPGEPARECEPFTWALELDADPDLFNSEVLAIDIDDEGFILFAGGTRSEATLRGSVIPSGDTSFAAGAFVARISPDGREVCWNRPLPGPQTNQFSRVHSLTRHGGAAYFIGRLESSGVTPEIPTANGPVSLSALASIVGAVDVATGELRWLRALNLGYSNRPEIALTDIGANADAVYISGVFDMPTTLSDHDGLETTHTPSGRDAALVRLRASDGGLDWLEPFGGLEDDEAAGVAVSGDRVAVLGQIGLDATVRHAHVRLYETPTEVGPGAAMHRTIESPLAHGLDAVFSGDQLIVLGTAEGQLDFAPGECASFEPSDGQVPFVVAIDSTSASLASLPSDSGSVFRMSVNAQPIATRLGLGPSRDGSPTVLIGGRLFTQDVSDPSQSGMGQLWFASIGLSPSSRERPRWIATYPNLNPALIHSVAADDDRVVGAGSFTNTFTLEPGHELMRETAAQRGGLLFSSAGDRPTFASTPAAGDAWRHMGACE